MLFVSTYIIAHGFVDMCRPFKLVKHAFVAHFRTIIVSVSENLYLIVFIMGGKKT